MEAIQPGCVSTYISTDQQQKICNGSSDGVDSSGYEQVDIYESSSTALAEDANQDVLPKQTAVSEEDGYECVEVADHREMETTCQQPSCPKQNVQDDPSIGNETDYSLYDDVPVSLHSDDDFLYEDIPPFFVQPIATPQPTQLGSHISSSPLLAQLDTRVPLPPQQCISVLAPPLPAQRSSYAQIPIPGCQVFPTMPFQRNLPPPPRSPKPGSSVLSEENLSSSLEPVQFGADQLQTLTDMYERLGKFLEKSQSTPVDLASLSSFQPQTVTENLPPSSGYENIYDEVEKSSATENTSERPKPPVPKPRKLKVSQHPPHLEADAQGKQTMHEYFLL